MDISIIMPFFLSLTSIDQTKDCYFYFYLTNLEKDIKFDYHIVPSPIPYPRSLLDDEWRTAGDGKLGVGMSKTMMSVC